MSALSPAAAAPPDPPAADRPPTKKPRGNPTLALIPRCGARTRAGCPCRAPAIHGKLRCRMHGGRSTGPRTPEGLARLRAARTIHGHDGAEARARDRWRLTFLRRARVGSDAQRYQNHLPPAFVARLYGHAPELAPPPRPTGGITAAQDRVRRRAVAAALAPWEQAIADARAAERAARAATRAARAAARAAGPRAKPHAPVGAHPPRDASVPGPLAPIPDAADLEATGRLANPPAPVGAHPPRGAGVPGPPAPIPVAADLEATGRLAKPPAPVGAHPSRGAGVPEPHAPDRAPFPGEAGGPKPHAPIPGPAAPAIPPGLPNRAARRRWKWLQRRLNRAPVAGTSA